jgi:hypothetical protein
MQAKCFKNKYLKEGLKELQYFYTHHTTDLNDSMINWIL